MECRPNCGACCIATSIEGAIPGMPEGKPAGVPCVNLDTTTMACRIWERDDYPALCRAYTPTEAYCGGSANEAIRLIGELEEATRP